MGIWGIWGKIDGGLFHFSYLAQCLGDRRIPRTLLGQGTQSRMKWMPYHYPAGLTTFERYVNTVKHYIHMTFSFMFFIPTHRANQPACETDNRISWEIPGTRRRAHTDTQIQGQQTREKSFYIRPGCWSQNFAVQVQHWLFFFSQLWKLECENLW